MRAADHRRVPAPKPVLLPRTILIRGVCFGTIVFIGLVTSAIYAMRRTFQAERALAAAAHQSSVRFVRLAMELQAELDEREEHDRATLQLYLSLEREHLPELQRAATAAAERCSNAAASKAVATALADFGEQAHSHSRAMLDALEHQAARAHRRAQELAQSMLAQARADRERLQLQGDAQWSDADLEGPLRALARRLRRPNATFELPLSTLQQWEAAYVDAMHEGGAVSPALRRRLTTFAQEAPLPRDDADRHEVARAAAAHDDPTGAFVRLLQRARLHRHLPQLLRALEGFERHELPVWDAVDMMEQLRAQHVFPMAMLRLAEHEWDQVVGGAAEKAGRDPHSFDADQ